MSNQLRNAFDVLGKTTSAIGKTTSTADKPSRIFVVGATVKRKIEKKQSFLTVDSSKLDALAVRVKEEGGELHVFPLHAAIRGGATTHVVVQTNGINLVANEFDDEPSFRELEAAPTIAADVAAVLKTKKTSVAIAYAQPHGKDLATLVAKLASTACEETVRLPPGFRLKQLVVPSARFDEKLHAVYAGLFAAEKNEE